MKLSASRQIASAFLLVLTLTIYAAAQEPELLIPANTKVSVQLLSEVSTATAKKNDKFTCRVLSPAEYAGSIIEGHVRSAKRSGRADKESKIDLEFDRISFADGRLANFSATVVEVFDVAGAGQQGRADNEGAIKNSSSTVKISAKRAIIGATIGALVGGAIAGGQGAVIGAAIGAGAGITSTIAMKGEDLNFRAGTQLTIQTDGPTRRRPLRKGETPISVPVEHSPGSTNPVGEGAPVLKRREYTPPATPSSQVRTITLEGFVVGMPDNWTSSGNKNQYILAPEGAVTNTNGALEVTHGVLLGQLNIGSNNLQQANEAFLSVALQRNSYLQKTGAVESVSIGGLPGLRTNLSGVGKEGRRDSVSIYTTLSGKGRLFYIVTTVPEAEAEPYISTFQNLVMSVRFSN